MLIGTSAIAATGEGDSQKPKYESFVFTPSFGEVAYFRAAHGHQKRGETYDDANEWLKTQIGSLKPEDFFVLGFFGLLRLDDGDNFIRMGVLAINEDLLRLNNERLKLKLPKVKDIGIGSGQLGKLNVFGVYDGGKEILKLERKILPIEKEWGVSEYLMNSRMPDLSVLAGKCALKSNLMAQDINLDGHPELFSFEGYYSGYMPEAGHGSLQYVSLHINDGVTGKEIFASVLKEQNSDDGGLVDPETYEAVPKGGYIRLSKLYFVDIDQNDRLDVLRWSLEYTPTFGAEVPHARKPGRWRFVGESFQRFEESPDGFKEVSVTTEQAKAMLNEQGLTWSKGFPDQSACKDGKTEPFTFFNDPVLH